jgi:hypothetical protein
MFLINLMEVNTCLKKGRKKIMKWTIMEIKWVNPW